MKKILSLVFVIVLSVFQVVNAKQIIGTGEDKNYNKALKDAKIALKGNVIDAVSCISYNPYGKTYTIDEVVEKALNDSITIQTNKVGKKYIVTISIDPDIKGKQAICEVKKYIEQEKRKINNSKHSHKTNLIIGVYYKAYCKLNDGYTEYLSEDVIEYMGDLIDIAKSNVNVMKIEEVNGKYGYYMGMGEQYKLEGFVYYDQKTNKYCQPKINELYGQFNREKHVTDIESAYYWKTKIHNTPLYQSYEEIDSNGKLKLIDVPQVWYTEIGIRMYGSPINLNGVKDAKIKIIIE